MNNGRLGKSPDIWTDPNCIVIKNLWEKKLFYTVFSNIRLSGTNSPLDFQYPAKKVQETILNKIASVYLVLNSSREIQLFTI